MNLLIYTGIVLIAALILLTQASLNIIMKKRVSLFMPFFGLGIALCLSAAFMFYNFFGIAVDVYLVIKLVAITSIFLMLWRAT